jgi:hypothetical protein
MKKANAALAEHNTRIEMLMSLGSRTFNARWPISTVQVEKGRGKPKAMGLVATFCPLCGEKLETGHD